MLPEKANIHGLLINGLPDNVVLPETVLDLIVVEAREFCNGKQCKLLRHLPSYIASKNLPEDTVPDSCEVRFPDLLRQEQDFGFNPRYLYDVQMVLKNMDVGVDNGSIATIHGGCMLLTEMVKDYDLLESLEKIDDD